MQTPQHSSPVRYWRNALNRPDLPDNINAYPCRDFFKSLPCAEIFSRIPSGRVHALAVGFKLLPEHLTSANEPVLRQLLADSRVKVRQNGAEKEMS